MTEELLSKEKGNSMFEKIGKASLIFARKYPVLFKELTLQPNPYMTSYETMENSLIETMFNDQSIKDWTLIERKRLLLKLRIFQLGMTVMVASNNVPTWLNNNEFDEMFMEVGDELLKIQQFTRKGKLL